MLVWYCDKLFKMRLLSVFLGLSVASSSFGLEGPHVWRRDNISTAPTEVDRKTAVEPKRFIVEFTQVSSQCLLTS